MSTLIASAGLKVAAPAVLAGYRAFSREWARRDAADPSGLNAGLEKALDDAIAVLAQKSDSLFGQAKVSIQGLISRPSLFSHPAAEAWISTERAQLALKGAVHALIRGESDAAHAADAIDHYQGFLVENEAETAPTGDESYVEALEYILRSLARDLPLSAQVILTAIDAVREQIATISDNSAIVDPHIESETLRIRQRRFFWSASTREASMELATSMIEGRLRGGSAGVRSRALAWCARLLAFAEGDLAALHCARARELAGGMFEELRVAEAFIVAGKDWERALATLDPDASPLQATAAFQIMRKGLDADAALARADAAAIRPEQMDGDGRYAWIASAVEADRWPEALDAIRQLVGADFEQTPALFWVAATALVAARLPADLRPGVLHDIPPSPSHFPLREDKAALEERRLAHRFMGDAAVRCAGLGLEVEAQAARRYALWLALRDPDLHEGALARLRDLMTERPEQLAHLPLALEYGLAVDLDGAEELVTRAAARNGHQPHITGAILALVFTHAPRDPERSLVLVRRHRKQLADILAPESLVTLEARLLIDLGRKDEARALVAAQDEDALPENSRRVLDSILGSETDRASLETLEASYAQNPQTHSLVHLVHRHREIGFSERYLELARTMLLAVPNASDAVDVVSFLLDNDRHADADALLEELGDIVSRSDPLLSYAAWLHFEGGRLTKAEDALVTLEKRRDEARDRALRYKLLVASGRWPELDMFVERQWAARDARHPIELAQWAALAAQIRSKRAEELIQAAVSAAPDDPQVLVTAYGAATTAGLEEKVQDAASWIMHAAEQSGEEGPVQRMSLEELLEQRPGWDAQVEEAGRALAAGEVPIGIAAAMVRRPWLELQLVPLLINPATADVRRHSVVPLYSGRNAREERLDLAGTKAVALDRTAIVTLAAFDLLKPVLASFKRIAVAHDLLSDLFDQLQRVDFHQPSRIEFAHHLTRLLGKERVKPFASTRPVNRALAAEIGESLAALLTEASAEPSGQHIVIHPFPITRVGSLLTEPVQLDAYRPHLASCLAVTDALERKGRLTGGQSERARAYLDLHDQRWPEEPRIEPGATLYLSDLAVSYLRFTGLLDRIESAGLTVIVSRSELDLASALRERETIAEQVTEIVERLRKEIAEGLASGKVVLDAMPRPGAEEEDARPFLSMARLAEQAALVVYDDRSLNRYRNFDHAKGQSRICSTHEMIDALVRDDRVDPACVADLHTRLRLSGVIFVPVAADELTALLAQSHVDDGRLRETAELRAVRENIRLAQARGWFDPQTEAPWLVALQVALVGALAAQWNDELADSEARARSNWLMQIFDTRDWSESIVRPGAGNLASLGIVLDIARICTATLSFKDDVAGRFAAWLEQEVLEPLWTDEPRLKPAIIDHLRRLIVSLGQDEVPGSERVGARIRMQAGFIGLPSSLQKALAQSAPFREALGLNAEPLVTIGGEIGFGRTRFLDAVARAYAAPGETVRISDQKRRRWSLTRKKEDESLVLSRGKQILLIRDISALYPDEAKRLAAFDAVLLERRIAPQAVAQWRARLAKAPLDADEIEELDADLAAFPGAVAIAIAESVAEGDASIRLLVPQEAVYYGRLIGEGAADDLADYVAKIVPAHLQALRDDDPVEKAKQALLLASHPTILAGDRLGKLDEAQWLALGAWVETSGDPLAMIGFLEAALPHASAQRDLEPCLLRLAKRIDGFDADDPQGLLHLFASVAILVDGELSQQGTLADWPPFRRRIAALAQAALVTRATAGQVDADHFSKFAIEQRGWRFFVQSLCDLRAEPRWRPDHMFTQQWRPELFGRLVNAAAAVGVELPSRLSKKLLTGKGSFQSRVPFPMAYWPGPIEGSEATPRPECPEQMRTLLEQAFAQEVPGSEALTLIVNLEAMFDIPDDLLDRAVERFQAAGSRLLAPIEPGQIEAYLVGLAYLAAGQRRPELAEIVFRLIRDWRSEAQLDIAAQMQVCLIAAAAWRDQAEWRKQVGNSVTEMAWSVERQQQAVELEGWLDAMCAIDPALRTTTSRARAALRLVSGS